MERRAGAGTDGPPVRARRPRRDDQEEYAPRHKLRGQRPVDLYSPTIRYVARRLEHRRTPYAYHVPSHEYYTKDLLPARHTAFNPTTALCTQWVNTSFHPDGRLTHTRVPLLTLRWSPTGRRLLCTTNRGEFLLFNGFSFGLEVKTAAHEDGGPCRGLAWGAMTDLIISGDDGGRVKMWRPSLVQVAELSTGHRAVREITFAPLEAKFCSCGQDGTARVWDTSRVGSGGGEQSEEVKLEGHGGDVTTAQWHPYNALIATGSQDTQCRLWDPRTAAQGSVAALHGHSQALSAVRWHPNGLSLLTAAKDGVVRLWDIRQLKPELKRFKVHTSAVSAVEWHPQAADLFSSAGADGRILHWLVSESSGDAVHGVTEVLRETAAIEAAHEKFRDRANPVNCLAWSPQGHVLASGGNEIKYWARNKPGALEERERGDDDDLMDMNDGF